MKWASSLLLHSEEFHKWCGETGLIFFSFHDATAPSGPGSPHYRGFTTILRHTARGRTVTSDQPDVETSTRQHPTLTREKPQYAGGIRTHNPRKRATADPRLIPRGHRDPWSGYVSVIRSLLWPGQLCSKGTRIIQMI
jgi:hypothetical protein